jgi:hypothetical protein
VYARVVTFSSNIDQAVVGQHVDLDVRVGVQEFLQDRGDDQWDRRAQHVQPERAHRGTGCTADVAKCQVKLFHQGLDFCQERTAGFRQADAAGSPIEEFGAELLLKSPDGGACRGVGNTQRLRGRTEALFLCHAGK